MKMSRDEILVRTEEYLIIPSNYLRIPGLHAFGYAKFNQAGEPLEDHYHPGCMEFTVMIGGGQTYRAGNTDFTLSAGDVFTNFTSEVHSTGKEPQGVSEFYFLELDMEEVDGFLGLSRPWDRQMHQKMKNWDRRIVKMPEEENDLVRKAFECFAELVESPDNMSKYLQGQGLLLAFFNQLLSKQGDSYSVTQSIQLALNYVGAHINEPLEPEAVAEAVGLSPAWLKRKFKEETGITLREYISRQKVERSKELLQKGGMTLTAVAFAVGYNDSSYFTRVFRQFTGCAPREYRRQLMRQNVMAS